LRVAECNQGVEEHKVPPAYEHADLPIRAKTGRERVPDSACSFTAVGMTMLWERVLTRTRILLGEAHLRIALKEFL